MYTILAATAISTSTFEYENVNILFMQRMLLYIGSKNRVIGVSLSPLLNIGKKVITIITTISGDMSVVASFTLFANAESTDITATIRMMVDMMMMKRYAKSLAP